jgi:hypothetical protein
MDLKSKTENKHNNFINLHSGMLRSEVSRAVKIKVVVFWVVVACSVVVGYFKPKDGGSMVL